MGATGLETAIHLPERKPLPHGRLLDVIEELPDDMVEHNGTPFSDSGPANRWMLGVRWMTRPCAPMFLSDADCDPTNLTDFPPNACDPWGVQYAFQVYDALKARATEFSLKDLDAVLVERMALQTSATFAHELLNGAGSGGISLRSTATPPTGFAFSGSAVPIWKALPILENELADRMQGAAGVIHLPPGLFAQAAGWFDWDDTIGQYTTALGNAVVGDAGYVHSVQPAGGGGASAAGEDWIYASGPVYYKSTAPEFLGTNPNASTNISRNELIRWLTSFGILVFDPCPVTAILASYTETS